MSIEDRLRSARLEADAAPLRAVVLAAAAGALRERRLWRWTWVAAAVVLAVAVPVNLSVRDVGQALASMPPADAQRALPKDLREVPRIKLALTPVARRLPRTVEELR